jgi:hypothetical protein
LGRGIAAGGAVAALALPTAGASEPDPIYAAIEAHRKAAAVEQAAWDEVNRLLDDEKISPSDECALTDGPNVAAWDAREKFAATIPTTLPGLLATIVYANEIENEDDGESFESDCLETLATAAQALMNGRVEAT